MDNPYQEKLWDYIKAFPQSPSHDIEHLVRVKNFANILRERYGGDYDVIMAAAILHDIGRRNPNLRSEESAYVAAREAENILIDINFPATKIPMVCSAIREHDQPNLIPSTIEGRIIKEADFLAGFGAWGIIRTAMFQGERGKSIEDVLYRLQHKMQERINSLEFQESVIEAKKEYIFVKYFLSLLSEDIELPYVMPGKYIAFEGISGTGKSTQINKLISKLESTGKKVLHVEEPGDYRSLLREARSKQEQLHVLLADRNRLMSQKVIPALEKGIFVISSRCYMSSLVYQAKESDFPYILFLHQNLPPPNLIFLLDVPAKIAYERILSRKSQTGQPLGKNETLERLSIDRQKYLRATEEFSQAKIIDGLMDEEDVFLKIWSYLSSYL